MEASELMNVSCLTALCKETKLIGEARPFKGSLIKGYNLSIVDEEQNRYIVSTYITGVKQYRNPESLLKDAKRIGLNEVIFLLEDDA
ncbi:hypothetical protein OCT63_18215 [Vibrio sp. RW]|uniref:hypothetical protein n=1 Tax=Vibrio sp. RW TaxID=2998833 RepID=UPI0022CD4FB8|nr:hypothetical protein [Vibrio sp. RW]MDA0146164.1 hypothetical protein [Vibrio sp. RW]